MADGTGGTTAVVTAGGAGTGGVPGRSPVVSAVLMMLVAGFMSSLLHLGVRYTSPFLPTIEIVALRSLFTILITLPFMWEAPKAAWTTNNWPLQLMRGAVGVTSMTIWYYALGQMPLADAGALSFTTGIFVTIGAALYFGEPVGRRRWGAVAVGLLGAVIVLRPGQGVISLAAMAAVGSSLLWAVSLLMAKELGRFDSSLTIAFYQPLMIAPVAMAATVPVWVTPGPLVWLALMAMGIAAAIGNYGYIRAMRLADASITMPVDYARLLWMVGWGYWLFAEIPDTATWIGAALIIGAALFITVREQQIAAERRRLPRSS
jgi:drug/metabolite transporter (DMT)-like permease